MKILVVDDEPIICDGIAQIIRMFNLEYVDEVLCAYSGNDALNIYNSHLPSILITDMQMTGMNGVELIRRIKESNNSVGIIVVSGYDDFEYVKQSFKEGSVDYLLKPAKISEVKTALQKVVDNLKQDRQIYDKDFEEAFRSIILSGDSHIESFLSTYSMKANLYKKCQLAVVNIQSSDAISLMKKFFDINDSLSNILHIKELPGILVVIAPINSSDEKVSEVIQSYCNKLKTYIEREHIHPYLIIYSSFIYDLEELSSIYHMILNQLSNRMIYDHHVLSMKSIESKIENIYRIQSIPEELKKLKEFMFVAQPDKASHCIDRLLEQRNLNQLNMKGLEFLYIEILKALTVESEFDDIQAITKFNKISDVSFYLKHVAYKICQEVMSNDEVGIIDIAIKYMEEHYMQDVTLAEVSNQVSMNYSYFSKFFKKETGKSFVTYLTEIRMREAKKLLRDPINKIHEVADKVGYEDPKYFSKVFKSYYGIAPNSIGHKDSSQS